jgi:hypothetical protein
VRKPLLVKIAVAAVAIGAFAVLFMRSVEDTRGAAYTIARSHLRSWTLAVDDAASAANAPLLVLRPAPELAAALFKQIFARAMESLNSPAAPSMPIVLRGEFDRVVADQMTKDEMLVAARAAGIETTAPSPRCLVHRRISEPGGVRQAYLVLFDAPAIARFRRQMGLDAEAQSPIMLVAGAGPDFNSWLPQRINANADCLAPIEIAP